MNRGANRAPTGQGSPRSDVQAEPDRLKSQPRGRHANMRRSAQDFKAAKRPRELKVLTR
jgi:hypothetical protein